MKALIGIGLALALGGCASIPSTGDISTKAKEIQAYTRTFCSFVPTIQTIVSIINAGAGQTLSIANDICAAVTTVPLADGGKRAAKVNVNGRVISLKGKFVR